MSWLLSIGRYLLTPIVLLLAVVTLAFVLIQLAPGNPAYVLAGDAPTPQLLAEISQKYGLDRPLADQLLRFIQRAAKGDFGQSIYYNEPVLTVIADRLPATLLLTITSMAVATLCGVLLGVWSAKRAGTPVDAAISIVSLIGYSVPVFWGGQLLILLFAVQMQWLPTGGMTSARSSAEGFEYAVDVATHLILPVATLAAYLTTMIARFTRTAMIEALSQDYITVAHAKGVPASAVIWRHGFRNAIVTTITIVGLEFGAILAGVVVIEVVFGWPGIGRLFYDAIFRRDFPLLIGAFVFTSAGVVLVNSLTDLLCASLDPRIRG